MFAVNRASMTDNQAFIVLVMALMAILCACAMQLGSAQLNNSEVLVLMSIKRSLVDPQNATSGWDSGFTDPCSWHYVTCSSDLSVTELGLVRLGLSGTLSSEIAKLTHLKTLSLEGNNISGTIPAELGSLSQLQLLDLAGNQLSGQIPESLGQLKSLSSLLLNNNSLSGTIPASLVSIPTLSSVDFSFNNLSGIMPNLSATSLRAEGNAFLCGDGTSEECGGSTNSLAGYNTHRQALTENHTRTVWIVSIVPALVVLMVVLLWWYRRCYAMRWRAADRQRQLNAEMCLGQLKQYTFRELQHATNNFSVDYLLGSGGSGEVFKGFLPDGSIVAVKRLKDRQAVSAFKVELEMISLAAHRNLLRLLGCCYTSTELVLVYPYIRSGSVASCLQDKPSLTWPARKRIALGSARGLVYLHEQCDPKIIHGDVKAANILVDDQGEAVVADFGLAKFLDHSVSHVTTAVRGTIGYIAPESLSGQISAKTDVYSYGILLLELIAGQTEIGFRRLSGQNLLDWVKRLHQEKRLNELVDEELKRVGYDSKEVEEMVKVALLCTLSPYAERPKMSEVLQMLEGDGLANRWEIWQKCEEERSRTAEKQFVPSYLDLLCDATHVFELQLSGPR